MNTTSATSPAPGLVNITHLIYGLHAFSVVAGILGAASVVGMMATGWPSIIAVILNYIKRSEAKGTWLESHFRWQIRTFWFSFVWLAIAIILIVTIVGALIGLPLLFLAGIWIIYRILRGWLKLRAGEPMPI